MGILSLSQTTMGLQIVEVEVQFIRGLPSLHILGRADSAIKECALRLKTAFQNLGWDWPQTQQIVVNLKPAHFKKESSGLDLAIALGIRQLQGLFPDQKDLVAFGEVDLIGNIVAPKELRFWNKPDEMTLLTGKSDFEFHFEVFEADNLALVEGPRHKPAKVFEDWLKVPQLKSYRFSKSAARLLEVVASGEHNVMLAGAAGSGKSTWAESLWTLLPPPRREEFLETRLFFLRHIKELKWRPFLQPHHTASTISMVGGGVPPKPGAFTMAHGGVLLLDEYLEFSKDIQEALREPMEKGQVHLFRKTEMATYPSRFQLVATTNLCPCGDFDPNKRVSCNHSIRRCRSHIERLSGPVVDRFDILGFTSDWKSKQVDLEEVKEKVSQAYEFRMKRGQTQANSHLHSDQILESLSKTYRELLPEDGGSQRRTRAVLRIARTLADLDQSNEIRIQDIRDAMDWGWKPFQQLRMC